MAFYASFGKVYSQREANVTETDNANYFGVGGDFFKNLVFVVHDHLKLKNG